MTEASSGSTARGDAATRIRLLDAAIHIASTQGLDKVTYRSVGAQAGLSHSLVRFYFGTGDAMLAQALERAARLDVAESRIHTDEIDEFGADFVEVVSGERGRGMLQYDVLLRAVRGGFPIEQVRALYDFYIDEVAGTLSSVGIEDSDGSLAALIFAALDGAVLQHAVYQSDERTGLLIDRIRSMLRLLQRESGQPPS